MLIDFNNVKNYKVIPRGVIHVGMHKAEEYPIYIENNIKNILFIEANKKLVEEMKKTSMVAWICNAAVSDSKELVVFNITNNGESSSILEMGDHAQIYPGIVNVERIEMVTQTLDEIFQIGEWAFPNPLHAKFYQLDMFNILNLDIQGVELKAMRGLTEWHHIEAVFSEVNYREMYKGCALVGEIDAFLGEKGFSKVEECDTGAGWGDALYIRNNLL